MYNTWPIAITMNAAGYVANTACCVSPLLSALSAKSAERNTSGHRTAGRLGEGCGSFKGLYTGAAAMTGGLSDRRTPMAWSQQDLQPAPQDQRPENPGLLWPAKQLDLHLAEKIGGGDLAG